MAGADDDTRPEARNERGKDSGISRRFRTDRASGIDDRRQNSGSV